MTVRTYRIDDALHDELDRAAKRRGVSRTVLVREALVQYLRSGERPEMTLVELADSLATHPGSGVTDLGTRSEEHLRARLGKRASGKRSRGPSRAR